MACIACALAFLGTGATARALTAVQFAPVHEALSNEVATLSAIENPTLQESKRLRTLLRASGVLTNTATADGKALRSLLNLLKSKSFPEYAPLLDETGSRLAQSYNTNFQFVVSLLPQLPDSSAKELAQKQLKALTPLAARLDDADRTAKIAALLDP
ncbi:MAG TPA: hypothetical protein VK530_18945, partial [Candidatus Acidoferrum sp.]|nr:hypothetical protein [Candidatus Acidoferrum sp.]